ncbi:LytR/AlgR family response regulator transcription factor [Flagellimonas sp. 2504JD4-2]
MSDLRALIVDDELNGIENLVHILKKYFPNVTILGSAQSLDMAESAIKELDPNLLFLDVQIGTRSIFELLDRLNTRTFEIIFLSAYDHAVRAFKFMAIDYLLKPIDISELRSAIERATFNIDNRSIHDHADDLLCAIRSSSMENQKIAVSTARGYEFVYVNEIMYCMAKDSGTHFFLKSKRIMASQELGYYEALLSGFNFIRIHDCNLINTSFVEQVICSEECHVLMKDGERLSIAKSRKGIVLKTLDSL